MEQTGNVQVAYCRICGKALNPEEQHSALGTVYCAEHVPATPPPPNAPRPESPWTATPSVPPPMPNPNAPGAPSPGLAFILGLIPGVGAIYNAQYAKGLIHVIVFGLLISVANADSVGDMQPLFGMLAPVFIFYMAFEAYHTAKNRAEGRPVEEFSSVIPVRPAGPPVGPAVMIGLGVIFLLNNLGVLRFSQIFKFWPIALICLGVYLLVERTRRSESEVGREQ
ncbi:MAG: LiaF transmembrane domain-containing protein [Bryobacteraceae bacterium]